MHKSSTLAHARQRRSSRTFEQHMRYFLIKRSRYHPAQRKMLFPFRGNSAFMCSERLRRSIGNRSAIEIAATIAQLFFGDRSDRSDYMEIRLSLKQPSIHEMTDLCLFLIRFSCLRFLWVQGLINK